VFNDSRYSVVISATKQQIAEGQVYQPGLTEATKAKNLTKENAEMMFRKAIADENYAPEIKIGVTRVSLIAR
jgi:hypothetical protein